MMIGWGKGPSTSSKRPPGPDRSQKLVGANSFRLSRVPSSCSFGVRPLVLGDDYRGGVMKIGANIIDWSIGFSIPDLPGSVTPSS